MDQRTFRTSPIVRASASADGLVLLDVRGGSLLASNLAGVRIWQLLERRSTPDGIARTLADEYDIPLDQARADVSAFLDALIARQLIVPEGAP